MKGLIDGVRFLHEHYVSHNDIKYVFSICLWNLGLVFEGYLP